MSTEHIIEYIIGISKMTINYSNYNCFFSLLVFFSLSEISRWNSSKYRYLDYSFYTTEFLLSRVVLKGWSLLKLSSVSFAIANISADLSRGWKLIKHPRIIPVLRTHISLLAQDKKGYPVLRDSCTDNSRTLSRKSHRVQLAHSQESRSLSRDIQLPAFPLKRDAMLILMTRLSLAARESCLYEYSAYTPVIQDLLADHSFEDNVEEALIQVESDYVTCVTLGVKNYETKYYITFCKIQYWINS